MEKQLSILIFCGFEMGNETGVHRFSKEIIKGISAMEPSTYCIYWNKRDGIFRGYIQLMKDFCSKMTRVNVVHFVVMSPAEIPIILLAKLFGKKILTTYHGDYLKQNSITGHPLLNALFWVGDKLFRKFSHALVSPSEYLFSELKFDSKKSFVIPNPFDLEQITGFSRKPKTSKDDDIIITSASNFNIKEKVSALYVLCDSFTKVSKDTAQIKLFIFGDGKYLRDFKTRFGGVANIKFMGFRSDFGNSLQTSDIYAHFSTFDNQPYALVDALMRGNVILCNNLQALTEMVDSINNYIVILDETHVVNAVRSIVHEIKINPESFYQKGLNNRKNALSKYSSKTVSIAYHKLYCKILSVDLG